MTGHSRDKLVVVGLSRETAPVQIRERAALDTAGARALLRSLQVAGHASEALVLSTCNRTEVYVVAGFDLADQTLGVVSEALAAHTRITREELRRLGYALWEERAVEHLFAVVAGLHSTVLGEGEIVAQARAAVALADDEGTLGRLLEGLLQQAIACGGRVRSNTAISRGATSIASVAIELAEDLLGGLSGRPTLVLGAGAVASSAAKQLAVRAAEPLVIANRSELSAVSLARRVGGRVVPVTALHEELRHVDLLVCATGAARPVLSRQALATATRLRHDTLVAIDLALPRDIEPTARELPRVTLRDIDEIQRIAADNLDGRRQELPRAWSIVRADAERFETWRSGLETDPLVRELRRRVEEIRRLELDRVLARYPDLDRDEVSRLDVITRSLTNRLLHEPTARIRRAGSTASGRRQLETLYDLLGAPTPPPHLVPSSPSPDRRASRRRSQAEWQPAS